MRQFLDEKESSPTDIPCILTVPTPLYLWMINCVGNGDHSSSRLTGFWAANRKSAVVLPWVLQTSFTSPMFPIQSQVFWASSELAGNMCCPGRLTHSIYLHCEESVEKPPENSKGASSYHGNKTCSSSPTSLHDCANTENKLKSLSIFICCYLFRICSITVLFPLETSWAICI